MKGEKYCILLNVFVYQLPDIYNSEIFKKNSSCYNGTTIETRGKYNGARYVHALPVVG